MSSPWFPKVLIKEVLLECDRDNLFQLSAALAFYAIFSLAPLLIIAITIAGAVYGDSVAQKEVFDQLQSLIGTAGVDAIQGVIQSVYTPSSSIFATTIGLVVLLWAASRMFRQLKISLDFIWNVPYKEDQNWRDWFRHQALAFVMVLGMGALLLLFVFSTTLAAVFSDFFNNLFPSLSSLLIALDSLIFFGLFTLFFAIIFKVLPDAKITWSDVWTGAALTAFLFTIGKFLIGMYLGYTSMGSAYGAAGAFVVILLWIYYSAQIFFIGAEFTQVYANKCGSRVLPSEEDSFLTSFKKDVKRSKGVQVALGVASGLVLISGITSGYFSFRKKGEKSRTEK